MWKVGTSSTPALVDGTRDMKLDAYRETRDQIRAQNSENALIFRDYHPVFASLHLDLSGPVPLFASTLRRIASPWKTGGLFRRAKPADSLAVDKQGK